MGTAVSNTLPELVTVAMLAEHTGRSKSTVYKWSSGERPSPYPEPVRVRDGSSAGGARTWRTRTKGTGAAAPNIFTEVNDEPEQHR